MLQVLFFLWKYKVLKSPENLPHQPVSFFKLSKKNQKKVLDKYFEKFKNQRNLETYFEEKEARYYEDNKEMTFFYCYYFNKKILEYNIKNLRLIDKFMIEPEKKDYLVSYALDKIKKEHLSLLAKDLVNYPDDLPKYLSSNIDFMTYLINQDESNIKYITYDEKHVTKQRELIKRSIEKAKQKEFQQRKFFKNNGELPKILETNLDFLIYLIENDITNISYLEEKLLDSLTISNKKIIVQTIITSLEQNPGFLNTLEQNSTLANLLNKEEEFITYIINENLSNIRYIDWHNLTDEKKESIINYFTKKIENQKETFDIMKYPFHELFFANYQFMNYLIKEDFRWIAITKVNSPEKIDKLIETFFQILEEKKYKFHLEDFLEDGEYLNYRLIENPKMLHYFFINKVPVVQYINFFNLTSPKLVTENILKEIEKKEYEFHNEDFLINNKYPIPLSNSYRFMRYVIDKNFNYLSYIDISMIDKQELKRIINYACRMVYYIRGDNKKLSFDIEGYFKETDILKDEYFQECLNSL